MDFGKHWIDNSTSSCYFQFLNILLQITNCINTHIKSFLMFTLIIKTINKPYISNICLYFSVLIIIHTNKVFDNWSKVI